MPRNDDIGDLPSLMPDSDEIKGTRHFFKSLPPIAVEVLSKTSTKVCPL